MVLPVGNTKFKRELTTFETDDCGHNLRYSFLHSCLIVAFSGIDVGRARGGRVDEVTPTATTTRHSRVSIFLIRRLRVYSQQCTHLLMIGSKSCCHQMETGTITCPMNSCDAMKKTSCRYPGALPVFGSMYQGSSPARRRGEVGSQ